MKILIVAMAESVHTSRWISQICDQDWDIHVFPSIDSGIAHTDLRNVTVHHSLYRSQKNSDSTVKFHGIPVISRRIEWIGKYILKKIEPNYRAIQLQRLIKKLKPDIIHSMETQAAGYLTVNAKKSFNGSFPIWIHTVWGSDIYLFGRLKEHREKIKDVLKSCDYYISECQRDIKLARIFGFKGDILFTSSAEGGFDLQACSELRQMGPVSSRRIILLKGYQGWAGRSLVGLRALERCADLLEDYEIVIYVAAPEVVIAAELFTESTGILTRIIPHGTPHQEIMRLHGKARLSIGLSISDGLPSSFLEALVMGAFPIQSNTSCADEWIIDGKSGFIVPPEDPDIIASTIRKAISDDNLVDTAAQINEETAKNNLDFFVIRENVIDLYTKLVTDKS